MSSKVDGSAVTAIIDVLEMSLQSIIDLFDQRAQARCMRATQLQHMTPSRGVFINHGSTVPVGEADGGSSS